MATAIIVVFVLLVPAVASAGTTRADQDEQREYPARAGSYEVEGDRGESSGVVASRQYPGYFWMIQDSREGEDRLQITALRIDNRTDSVTAGTLLDIGGANGGTDNANQFQVVGASNHDWEAMAIDSANNLWVADSGNDGPDRGVGRVYVFNEPDPLSDGPVQPDTFYEYRFAGSDKIYNVEAMFAVGDHMYLITKTMSQAQVYRLLPIEGVVTALVLIDHFEDASITRITGADLSYDGKEFVVTSQRDKRARIWRRESESIPTTMAGADDLVRRYISSESDFEHYYRTSKKGLQVEAVAFSLPSEGRSILMMSEGRRKHAFYVRSNRYDPNGGGGGDDPACTFQPAADGQFFIQWDEIDGTDRYLVYRSVNGNGPYWRMRRSPGDTSWLDDKNRAPAGADVVYEVRSIGSDRADLATMICSAG